MSSNLSGWMDAINRSAEASAKKDAEILQSMKDALPAELLKLESMNNEDLLDHYQASSMKSYSMYRPEEGKLWAQLADRAKELILERMK